jgi:hypothetical protein
MHDDGAAGRPAAPLHRRREVVATGQAGGSRQQRREVSRAEECSGRQFAATFAAARRHDGAPGAGPHAQPEPMSPRAATVVRLERALALGHGCRSPGARCSVLICAGSQRRITAVGHRAVELRSVIPCRHRRHYFRAGPTRHATRRVVARAHKSTRRWAGDLASLCGQDRRRQNERLPSLQGRHAVTPVMLAIPEFLWQGQTLLNVPALAAPEDRRRTVHGLIRRGFEECADRCC